MSAAAIVRAALVALAGASLACGDGGGPVGAPGGRNGLELLYATPRLRVVPAGAEISVRVALVVRRQGEDGASVPLDGARLTVAREEGRGALSSATAVTGPDGLAAVDVRMPADPDLTRLVFRVEGDPGSYLPFDVLTAPVVEADLDAGTVRERLAVPKDGALVRFRLEADSEVILIPYETDVDRTGAAYRLLYQGAQPDGAAAAFGIRPPPFPQSLAPGEEAGDVVTGAAHRRGSLGTAAVPESIDIQSCMVSVSRQAPLRYLGTRVALYVDAPPAQLQARIDSVGRAFDDVIFPTNSERFGATPDRDGNGVVIVVLTPALEGVDGVYCDSIRKVDAEALYVKWAADGPLEQILSTLAHEHQHLVNAGYHVQSDGDVGDVRWLNEAMSLAAEAYSGYWRETLIRTWQLLNGQNGGLTMLPLDYVAAFDDRYMAFALYLEDRFPGALKALNQSGRRGVANVEFVTGVPFEDLLRDWFLALAVSNQDLTADPRFSYHTLDLQGMEAEIQTCGCLPVTALSGMRAEPLHLSSSFDAARMLDRADADYYRLVPPAGEAGTYDVYFDAFGREFVELAVARTR